MGSKNRIAKEILAITLRNRQSGQWYVEPFCGGSNIIDKVNGNRMANDINPYLIAFSKALQEGWEPPKDIDKEFYEKIKKNIEDYPKELVGYVGFQLSYGAIWLGGYRRDNEGKRNYALEAYNNVIKQAPNLKGIVYSNTEYWNVEIPDNSIIYCDPPYRGTAKYKANESGLDYDKFYDWCRDMSQKGHQVFVSEYNMPEDFQCLWQKEISSSLSKDTGAKKGVEKLFALDYSQSVDIFDNF